MTTLKDEIIPLNISPGVQPDTDKTPFATQNYTFADKIRFRFGFPQKIGGWNSQPFAFGAVILGYARTLYSGVLTTALNTLIGTNLKLYTVFGSILTNITPLQTSTTAIAASLASDFTTLGSNPIASHNGSGLITITDSNYAAYQSGDTIVLSGATAFNGLTTGNLNAPHIINTVSVGSYTVVTGGTATSSGSGGGASVVRATGLVTVTATANGQATGNRVGISGATASGGITTGQINAQFIIRNALTNSFQVMTTGTATSSVTGAGGASTVYSTEIGGGAQNQAAGQGYGAGLYGVGLYGTALISPSGISYPRIWFIDRFGANFVMTAGNQTGVYAWTGSSTTAPALVANAPTAVNYSFVSNNILVTLGAGGIGNQVFSSDQGSMTTWTASSSNQVYQNTIQDAATFVSHVPVGISTNLLFTNYQTYLMSYVPFVAGQANAIWNIQKIEPNIGIIAPMARCSVFGVAYWMGQNNFYMYTGGFPQIIPSANQTNSTILNYVFTNINRSQISKCFAWYNEQFDEIWFHYPMANSNEPNAIARLNRTDLTWTPDTMDRICAEYPNLTLGYPRLISSTGVLYGHEQGTDADGQPMPFTLTSNLRGGNYIKNYLGTATTKTSNITAIVPDSVQTGNISVTLAVYKYPQSATPTSDKTYTITPTTEQVPLSAAGRVWEFTVSGNALGQSWIGGQWQQKVQEGPRE
jgi:hypothetical protein